MTLMATITNRDSLFGVRFVDCTFAVSSPLESRSANSGATCLRRGSGSWSHACRRTPGFPCLWSPYLCWSGFSDATRSGR